MEYYIVTVKMHPYTQKRGESLYQNVTSGSMLMGNLYFLFFLIFFFFLVVMVLLPQDYVRISL